MREIKFRIWDKDRKVMANVSNIDFLTGQVQMNGDGNMHSERVSGDKVILLQYTGLKDKNGVEIYEGDIVECFNDGLSEVLFRKGSFGMFTYTSKGVDFYTFNEVYGFCEIIGNIYENPELLEREN